MDCLQEWLPPHLLNWKHLEFSCDMMISHLRNKSEVCSSKQTKVDGQVFNTSLEKMWISCSFKKVFQTEIISNQNEYQIGNNGNNGNTSSDIETTKPVLRKL